MPTEEEWAKFVFKQEQEEKFNEYLAEKIANATQTCYENGEIKGIYLEYGIFTVAFSRRITDSRRKAILTLISETIEAEVNR